MFCKKCGKELKENAKFCGACGMPVGMAEQKKQIKVCRKCGFKTTDDEMYCEECGTLLTTEVSKPINGGINERINGGRLLREYKGYSLYDGKPTVGVAKATGTLRIYNDRIVFEKVLGNAASGIFGAIGIAIGAGKAKKDPIVTYYYSNITKVEIGKYGGVYNTVVLINNDGRTVTFCPFTPGSSQPDEILKLIKKCMN